jgi:hypothetical protein
MDSILIHPLRSLNILPCYHSFAYSIRYIDSGPFVTTILFIRFFFDGPMGPLAVALL